MHRFFIFVLLFSSSFAVAQEANSLFQTKKFALSNVVVLDSLSINPSYFNVADKNGKIIEENGKLAKGYVFKVQTFRANVRATNHCQNRNSFSFRRGSNASMRPCHCPYRY